MLDVLNMSSMFGFNIVDPCTANSDGRNANVVTDLPPEIRGMSSVACKSLVLSKVVFEYRRLRLGDCLSQTANTTGYSPSGGAEGGSCKDIGHRINRLFATS